MLIARAYAKINWALDILGTRENGYHELDMLMQSVSLCDELTFEEAQGLTLMTNGQPDPYAEKNLIIRAARLLKEKTGCEKGARIRLTKRIPAMAGLGGGSADCAAALYALTRLWGLTLSREELLEAGFSLGADVPFCLTGGLCRVRGLGERIDRLNPAEGKPLLIVMPDGGLSTGAVFGGYDRMDRTEKPVDMDHAQHALLAGDYRALEKYARNVLTTPASQVSAAVEEAVGALYGAGALMARMSGSGSAVFGVFEDAEAAENARISLCGRYAFCESVRIMPSGFETEEAE